MHTELPVHINQIVLCERIESTGMGVSYINVAGELHLTPRQTRFHANIKGRLAISALLLERQTEPLPITLYLKTPKGQKWLLGIVGISSPTGTDHAFTDAPVEFRVEMVGTYWIQAYLDEALLHETGLPVFVHRSMVPEDSRSN